MVIHLHAVDQYDVEIKEGTVVVDFYADWCGPCKMLAPELEQLAKEENVKVVKINVDELPALARQFGIMNIPALFLYKDGVMKNKKLGYLPLAELKKFLYEF